MYEQGAFNGKVVSEADIRSIMAVKFPEVDCSLPLSRITAAAHADNFATAYARKSVCNSDPQYELLSVGVALVTSWLK
jgi:hypothetical protein